jgi:hypothetical protein
VSWETDSVAGTRELDRASTPGTDVPCLLKQGARIAVGRCVEWQTENDCYCPQALVAIGRMQELLEEPPRVAKRASGPRLVSSLEEAEVLRAGQRDTLVLLQLRAERIESQRSAAPTEEPMPHVMAKCGWTESPCEEEIRANTNKTGLCGKHSNIKRMREKYLAEKDAKPTNGEPAIPPAKERETRSRASPAPQSGDVVSLLEAKREQLRAELGKVERALEVLVG